MRRIKELVKVFKDFPPLWEPKKKGKYQHRLLISNPVLIFTSEKKLEEVKRLIESNIEYPPAMQKRKVALPSKDGYIEY